MNWMEDTVRREASRDRLRGIDVLGEVVAIVVLSMFITFLAANQAKPTGLFTSDFGPVEMAAFYGSLLYGYVPPLLRIFLRRRNTVRPFEIIGNGLFIIAASYLIYVFPFDFSHITALFPEGFGMILVWLTDDVAKIILTIAAIIAAIVSIWQMILYHLVKDWMGRKGV